MLVMKVSSMIEKVLVDTNVAIAHLKKDSSLLKTFDDYKICLSAIVIGELFHGAYKSAKVSYNLTLLSMFLKKTQFILVDADVARSYGYFKVYLKSIGKPIPENDLWIAATAKASNLPLATRDKHFKHLAEEIVLVEW